MSGNNLRKMSFRTILGGTPVEPDNDPVTVAAHDDANTLFANLTRARADLFAAKHAVTEAQDAERTAQHDYQAAVTAMMKLFSDHDLVDLPLPGEAKA